MDTFILTSAVGVRLLQPGDQLNERRLRGDEYAVVVGDTIALLAGRARLARLGEVLAERLGSLAPAVRDLADAFCWISLDVGPGLTLTCKQADRLAVVFAVHGQPDLAADVLRLHAGADTGSSAHTAIARSLQDDGTPHEARALAAAHVADLLARSTTPAIRAEGTRPSVLRVLDLHIGHLPADVSAVLDRYEGVTAQGLSGGGWLLEVPSDHHDRVQDLPSTISTLWHYAAVHDCTHVRLGGRGETVDGLPHWD